MAAVTTTLRAGSNNPPQNLSAEERDVVDWSKLTNIPSVVAGSGLTGGGQLTNDVTVSLTPGSIGNSSLATVPNNTLKGNVSGGTATPSDLSAAQVTGILAAGNATTATGTSTTTLTTPSDVKYGVQNGTFFTQTGTGAVARTIPAKLKDIVSVKDFGAAGDGVADDKSAIQAAIDALPAAGGGVYFPTGTYLVSGAVTLNKPGVYFGDGWATNIRTSSGTANVFTVTAQQVCIFQLKFTSSATRTAGWYVDVDSAASRFRISDFAMDGAINGIRTQATATATIERGQILNCTAGTGLGIRIDAGLDVTVRDVLIDQASQIFAGIYITNAGDVAVEDCQILHSGAALYLEPGVGQVVASVWANNCFFDTSTRGAYLNAASGSIVRCLFDQCWYGSNSFEGVRLSSSGGGSINGVEFNGCHFFLNSSHGLNIVDTGVSNIRISDSAFAQNGGSGVNVAANVGNFSVQSSRIGNTHGLTGNAGDGITIAAGTGDNIHIVNNDLRGNTGSALSLGATGSSVITDNNIGYGPWIQYTPTVVSTSGSITTLGTVVGRYRRLHKTLQINLSIPITTNGTGAGAITATLPSGFLAASDSVLAGRENLVSGSQLQGSIVASSGTISISKYDNTYPGGNGYGLILSGTIELQ